MTLAVFKGLSFKENLVFYKVQNKPNTLSKAIGPKTGPTQFKSDEKFEILSFS